MNGFRWLAAVLLAVLLISGCTQAGRSHEENSEMEEGMTTRNLDQTPQQTKTATFAMG